MTVGVHETLLVIDDEEAVLRVVARILRRAGYRVLTAIDGPSALDLFRERRADIRLVILDMTLPHMDGNDILHELRVLDDKLAILIASGRAASAARRRFEGHASVGFIQKPFRSAELLTQVRQLLDGPGEAGAT